MPAKRLQPPPALLFRQFSFGRDFGEQDKLAVPNPFRRQQLSHRARHPAQRSVEQRPTEILPKPGTPPRPARRSCATGPSPAPCAGPSIAGHCGEPPSAEKGAEWKICEAPSPPSATNTHPVLCLIARATDDWAGSRCSAGFSPASHPRGRRYEFRDLWRNIFA